MLKTINGIELDSFTQAYVECALWSSITEDGTPLDADYCYSDIAPDSLKAMAQECADFETNAELLAQSNLSSEQAGHDFWLTRNGHGAGFWDRGLGQIGKDLTAMAKPYGSCDLYVGDDGQIYAS